MPKGEITLEEVKGTFRVDPFYIAKYPVTWIQYRSFLEAEDGYRKKGWWKGLAKREDQPGEQFRKLDNHPAENVSWYDAVAFCRWLTEKLGYEVRLPTEWEWQQAATGGDPANEYPWGPEWDSNKANTLESGLSRTTAVGMYPQGAIQPVRALDMSGNVREWCLNEYENPKRVEVSGEQSRAVRGGSWAATGQRALRLPSTTTRLPTTATTTSVFGWCARPPSPEPLVTGCRVSGKGARSAPREKIC